MATTAPAAAPPEDRRLKAGGLAALAGAGALFAVVAERAGTAWPPHAAALLGLTLWTLAAGNVGAVGLLLLVAGCGGARPLRQRGRRRALALQLLLANLAAPAIVYGVVGDQPQAQAALAESGLDMPLSAAAALLAWAGWRVWRRSRRHEAPSADEAMARDPRPPVLYLRSFGDDGEAVLDDGAWPGFRAVMRALQPLTPEQEMAEILGRVGPVVAIGRPGEPLPELGAARLYVSHEAWQARVLGLMDEAALVVVRVGASPGVLWEIEQALARLPRRRLVFALFGRGAVAPEIAARLAPVVGTHWPQALAEPPSRGWTRWLFQDPRRRIGGLVCFDDAGRAHAVPVRRWPLPWRDLLVAFTGLRPSAAPLRAAWRQVFARLGDTEAAAPRRRSRALAVVLALLLGSFGAQWFYLGRPRRGWLYVASLPLLVAPLFLSFFDALRFVWVERAEFDRRFAAPA